LVLINQTTRLESVQQRQINCAHMRNLLCLLSIWGLRAHSYVMVFTFFSLRNGRKYGRIVVYTVAFLHFAAILDIPGRTHG
jgi:hypothetical protein